MENVEESAWEWLNKNQLSYDIWNKKYRKDEGEDFEQWLDRVSGGDKEIRDLIKEKKFLFGGRILAGRGIIDRKQTLSNCYVLPSPEDNLESIFNVASMMARTYSTGGGCGINISKLRPKDSIVHNAASTTTGPTSFMEFYSHVTGLIGQNNRRGALLIAMDCHHPDIEEFINLKTKQGVCEKANISVMVTDDFMRAVENNQNWTTRFNSSQTGVIEKTFKARDLLKLLAQRNWEWAEPGILYWDRITGYNLNDNNPNYKLEATNPCGELPLQAGNACLLGSINLSEFVLNPFTASSKFDLDSFINTVGKAVYALNQVLDEGIQLHPLKIQRDMTYSWRPIGLGTMGLADMLIKLGIRYGSEESVKVLEPIYREMAIAAIKASISLAKKMGCYLECDKQLLCSSNFIKNLKLDDNTLRDLQEYGLYNSQLLTCAPTGSIATLLETSTGVESNFALKYYRKTQSLNNSDTFYEVNAKIVTDYHNITGDNTIPDYFVESKDINPIDRIKVQSILQKYIDNSISSTINLPEEATIEDIYNIYIEAWKYGLKGCTVYRQHCYREGILSTNNSSKKESESSSNELARGYIIPASNKWIGLKRTLTTGCGSLHCTAYFDTQNGELRECYLSKGSTGGW